MQEMKALLARGAWAACCSGSEAASVYVIAGIEGLALERLRPRRDARPEAGAGAVRDLGERRAQRTRKRFLTVVLLLPKPSLALNEPL